MDRFRDNSNINDSSSPTNADLKVDKTPFPFADNLSFVVGNSVLNQSGLNRSGIIVDHDSRIVYEDIRFVLFLSDAKFFNGAFTLLESLWESRNSTAFPPLVMVVGNSTIQPVQQAILESLGAEVKILSIPPELDDAIKKRRLLVVWSKDGNLCSPRYSCSYLKS
jgi:hypothetical protein